MERTASAQLVSRCSSVWSEAAAAAEAEAEAATATAKTEATATASCDSNVGAKVCRAEQDGKDSHKTVQETRFLQYGVKDQICGQGSL